MVQPAQQVTQVRKVPQVLLAQLVPPEQLVLAPPEQLGLQEILEQQAAQVPQEIPVPQVLLVQ